MARAADATQSDSIAGTSLFRLSRYCDVVCGVVVGCKHCGLNQCLAPMAVAYACYGDGIIFRADLETGPVVALWQGRWCKAARRGSGGPSSQHFKI